MDSIIPQPMTHPSPSINPPPQICSTHFTIQPLSDISILLYQWDTLSNLIMNINSNIRAPFCTAISQFYQPTHPRASEERKWKCSFSKPIQKTVSHILQIPWYVQFEILARKCLRMTTNVSPGSCCSIFHYNQTASLTPMTGLILSHVEIELLSDPVSKTLICW